MPRPCRIFFAGAIHHVFARGNNKMALFLDPVDFRVYRKLWLIAKARFNLRIYRWTWMTNHIHLLLEQLQDTGLAEAMHFVQGRYARYFARKYGWKGHVWESRYSNRLILDDKYFSQCAQYIEDNPVKAKMVERAEDYPWSSAAFYSRGYRDPLTDRESRTEVESKRIPAVPDELLIGRHAVGTRQQLLELSKKIGHDLLKGVKVLRRSIEK